MNGYIKILKLAPALRGSVVEKFLVGLTIINITGAIACWIVATKYPEQSVTAALWAMGSIIGFLIISIEAIHRFSPVQNGSRCLIGMVASGFLLLNMTAWMLVLVISMGAADGPALFEDFLLITKLIWAWVREIFT